MGAPRADAVGENGVVRLNEGGALSPDFVGELPHEQPKASLALRRPFAVQQPGNPAVVRIGETFNVGLHGGTKRPARECTYIGRGAEGRRQ
jgi:hypothetical protein